MELLKELFDFYLANQAELVEQYNGKYIILVNNQVVGAFDTMEQAYNYAESKYELGTFLIQLCTPGNEAYTQYFVNQFITQF